MVSRSVVLKSPAITGDVPQQQTSRNSKCPATANDWNPEVREPHYQPERASSRLVEAFKSRCPREAQRFRNVRTSRMTSNMMRLGWNVYWATNLVASRPNKISSLLVTHRPQLPPAVSKGLKSIEDGSVHGGRELLRTSPEASPCVAGAAGRIPDPPPWVGLCPSAIYFEIY